MQLIYQMEASGEFDISKLNLMEEDAKVIGKKQADDTLAAIKDHLPEIDKLISENLENWSLRELQRPILLF